MARGEVKEAIGQGSSPMREALCPRLKALCEVVLAARRCLERQWSSILFWNFPFWGWAFFCAVLTRARRRRQWAIVLAI